MNSGNYVHLYTGSEHAPGAADPARFGGLGAELRRLSRIGVPVPPGFTIIAGAGGFDAIEGGVSEAIGVLEVQTERRFGDRQRPLLLSVRADRTVLDLGLDAGVLDALSQSFGRRFALDCHRRFLSSYGAAVLGLEGPAFDAALADVRRAHGSPLSEAALADVVERYRALIASATAESIPTDPRFQLADACRALSSNFERPVTVSAMVYGNSGPASATGVAFTHDPITGARRFFGEYLPDSQGDDVDAATRPPIPISAADGIGAEGADAVQTLERAWPQVYGELKAITTKLEAELRDMLDVRFVVEAGRLWITHATAGRRSATAAAGVVLELVDRGVLDAAEALARLTDEQVAQLLDKPAMRAGDNPLIAHGLPASPGIAEGVVVMSSAAAQQRGRAGESVILVVAETAAGDVPGMQASAGIVTARGGLTSHAAIAARSLSKPCIVGTTELALDMVHHRFVARGHTISEGDRVGIDGLAGNITAVVAAALDPPLVHAAFSEWAAARSSGHAADVDAADVLVELEQIVLERTETEEHL